MKRLASFFVFILLVSASLAQSDKKLNFINVGPGIHFIKTQDLRMSTLAYAGPNFILNIGHNRFADKFNEYTEGSFSVGNLSRHAFENDNPNLFYFSGRINYRYERLLASISNQQFKYYLGGQWSNFATFRIHRLYTNNSFNYEFISSLDVAPAIVYHSKLGENQLQLRGAISLPIVAAVVRPGYVSTQPEPYLQTDSWKKAFFECIDITSWNRYFNFNAQFAASYFLANGNGLRLTYHWEYYHYNRITINKVSNRNHGLSLATMFNF